MDRNKEAATATPSSKSIPNNSTSTTTHSVDTAIKEVNSTSNGTGNIFRLFTHIRESIKNDMVLDNKFIKTYPF
jgi:hypothetical protein